MHHWEDIIKSWFSRTTTSSAEEIRRRKEAATQTRHMEYLDVLKFDTVMKAMRGLCLVKMLKASNLLRECKIEKLVFFFLSIFIDDDALCPLTPMHVNCKRTQTQEKLSIDLKMNIMYVIKNALKQYKRALDLYVYCFSIVNCFKESLIEHFRTLNISRLKFERVFQRRNYLNVTQIRLTNGASESCRIHLISLRNYENYILVSSFKQLQRSPAIKRTSTTTQLIDIVSPFYIIFHPAYNYVYMVISDIYLLCICATYIHNDLKMCAYYVFLCHHIVTCSLMRSYYVIMKSRIKYTLRNNHISTYSVSSLRRKIWLPLEQLQYNRTYTIFPAFAPMMSIVDRLAKREKVHPKESMRYEMMRFLTLRSYPSDGKPSVLKFAKAGFYYAANKDEVICYCCAKRISNWKPDDDPYQAHKRITPSCSFIVNNGEVNVPVSSETGSNSNDVLQKIITDLDKNNNVWRFDPENSGSERENDIETDDDEANEDQNNGTSLVSQNYIKTTPERNYNVIDTVTRSKDSGYVSLPTDPTNASVSLDEDCFRPEPQGGFASMAPISEYRRLDPTSQTGIVLPLKDLHTQIKTIHTTAYQPTQDDPPRQRKSNRISRRRTRRQRQSSTPSDPSGMAIRTETSGRTSSSHQQSSVPASTATNKTAQHLKIPEHPKFSTISSRIASFNQCPEIHVMPKILAEAGFYYAGIGDCTRCFWCGIGLRHWSREDDPWTEHARFSLECDHVIINKGQEFINLVKLALDLTEEKDGGMQAQAQETPAETQETERPQDDLEDLMTSEAAQSVREMGYTDDIIKNAIREVMNSKGKEKVNGMYILEEILRIEDTQAINTKDSPQISSTVPHETKTNTPTPKNGSAKHSNQFQPHTSAQALQSKVDSAGSDKKSDEHRQKRRLKNENKALKESTICSSCSKKEVCIVFLPCGHLISCEQCGSSVMTCMTCGQRVRGTVRTYRA